MIRTIIHIDEEKCNGCGICATACHEGAIDMVDGKAKLVREHFCDGFGDCLPACPTGAITFEEREAPAYDEAAVQAAQQEQAAKQTQAVKQAQAPGHPAGGCPGSRSMQIRRPEETGSEAPKHPAGGCPGSRSMQIRRPEETGAEVPKHPAGGCPGSRSMQIPSAERGAESENFARPVSRLSQWPVQIKLLPTQAPFYDGAKLLIAADCTAYAYANIHEDFIKGRVTLIGCPKLDAVDYTEKLTEIIAGNQIRSVTILRMDVPCCGGLQRAAEQALKNSGKFIPWQVVTIGRDGQILDA
ncbi:hypothetical protein CXIVA_12430 [Clostridium sp. SY8519]|uniref:ATP-binding protein n=1 Tax=Clostridium sp. (strain SY8519) TaxID=1042156 RepID=UPI0002171E8E|nr:4Fe-4S dicluster domain-containing protein [Clostridium sp. SY8519]BAK47209.1 hypothetical protein CXIVA_12430 [Clostridium sp. SY8519]